MDVAPIAPSAPVREPAHPRYAPRMTPSDGPDPGLQTPHAGALGAMEPVRRRSGLRIALQIVGALVGLALMGWALSIAFGEENRAGLERLRQAPAGSLAALAGLTFVTVTLNGLLFWVVLRPIPGVPRVRALRIITVNTIPTLLAILPFKLGFVVRIALHHRLDGLSFKHLGAWMGAFGALTLAVLVPPTVGAFVTEGALWWVILGAGPALCLVALAFVAHLATTQGLLHRLMLGAEGALRAPSVLLGTYLLRTLDIIVQGARFALAASLVGVTLSPEHAMLLGASYFLIVALAPAGALGIAEMGTAGVAALVGLDHDTLALVAIVVTVAHYAGTFLLALPSCLVVRPDRLLRREPVARGSLPSA